MNRYLDLAKKVKTESVPLTAAKAEQAASFPSPASPPASPLAPLHPCPLTEEDVRRFEAAGKKYCIQTAKGQIWLVPKHTKLNRIEVTGQELYEALRAGGGLELRDRVNLIFDALRMFNGRIINVWEEEGGAGAGKAN